MATFKQTLTANKIHKLSCNGYFFQLLSASANIKINFIVANTAQPDSHESIPVGFWFKSDKQLSYIEVESTVDQEISYLVANGQTGIDRSVLITELSQSTVISNKPRATVNNVLDIVATANDSRKRLMFRADETNTGVIYLGGADVTADNAVIALSADDVWLDNYSAKAAYYAIATAAGQKLRICEA